MAIKHLRLSLSGRLARAGSRKFMLGQTQRQLRCYNAAHVLVPDNARPVATAPASAWAARTFRLLPNGSDIEDPFAVNNALVVQIGNSRLRFDAVWLRDSCRCPDCADLHSGQKSFQTAHIPTNIGIRSAVQHPDKSITLKWRNDVKGFARSHATRLMPGKLSYGPNARLMNTNDPWPKIWSRSDMESQFRLIDYVSFMKDDTLFGDALIELQSNGLIFLENVPESEESVELIAQKIGPLRHTFYGKSWNVKDVPKAENVAYTSKFLGMHMDLLYMKDPPGVQLLHCLKASPEGGESIFYDSFLAAKYLEKYAPAAFEDLVNTPITYNYGKGGHSYTDSKPTIELRKSAERNRDGFAVIANVNWSPPFQGILLDTGVEDWGRKLRQYHLAAKVFASLVDNPRNQFTHLLRPGQCVLFLNRRILHGRKQFESGKEERWLKGAYLDTDVFQSKLHRYWMEHLRTKGGAGLHRSVNRNLEAMARTETASFDDTSNLAHLKRMLVAGPEDREYSITIE